MLGKAVVDFGRGAVQVGAVFERGNDESQLGLAVLVRNEKVALRDCVHAQKDVAAADVRDHGIHAFHTVTVGKAKVNEDDGKRSRSVHAVDFPAVNRRKGEFFCDGGRHRAHLCASIPNAHEVAVTLGVEVGRSPDRAGKSVNAFSVGLLERAVLSHGRTPASSSTARVLPA